jgi:two-component system, cell cycle response regulator DivK
MTTLLLVEDDEMNRDMLARRLKKEGYEIIIAADGARAIMMARQEQPDLILMDMGLPLVSGWQAVQRLKAIQETHAIPIIALTAYAMPEDRAKSLSIGCDEFQAKPVDFERLGGLIKQLLAGSASSREV